MATVDMGDLNNPLKIGEASIADVVVLELLELLKLIGIVILFSIFFKEISSFF
jgi:hypothetical protein